MCNQMFIKSQCPRLVSVTVQVSIHSAKWKRLQNKKKIVTQSSRYVNKEKVIRYNGLFLMRQFEVLNVKIVKLKEQKDNCFRGFFFKCCLEILVNGFKINTSCSQDTFCIWLCNLLPLIAIYCYVNHLHFPFQVFFTA